ncbi:adenine phosphoribosyltransferase [Brooklawnia sp.]|uniref:adenine phosphoribosyltransferase n=1 Tax=Brooklawnia sp. TaxID=2699740 RepID=UPI00311E9DB0
MTDQRVIRAANLIRTVLDFPKPGIRFRDITPLLGDVEAFGDVIDVMAEHAPCDASVVCGVESRGFIFGTPLALRLGVGFVPIRKPGKLPGAVVEESFDLEYGSTTLAVHTDALLPDDNVLLVDDLLATGGTLQASKRLVERLGASVAQIQVVLELVGQPGRETLINDGVDDIYALIGIED